MSEKTKVLFIPTTNAGVTYWRMWNYANAIHNTGAGQASVMWYDKKQIDLSPWEYTLQDAVDQNDHGAMYRITNDIWSAIRQSDAIVFGMVHCRAALDLVESVIELRNAGHLRNVPILTEIDDNILSVPIQNPAFKAYSPGSEVRRVTERQLRVVDGVIVSTPYLKDIFTEFNKNIYVCPNSIDWKLWGSARNHPKPGIRIGWSGGSAHNEDLGLLKEVIPNIIENHKDVRFVFLHGIAPYLVDMEKKYPGHIELHKEWAVIDKYPAKIASLDIDIFVAPLIDSAFNRGKSNLRWLEAAALGIPCVASNVGNFEETITHTVDGMLCETENDWTSCLNQLIGNKLFRRKMGAAARQTALELFDVNRNAYKYIENLDNCENVVADRAMTKAQEDLEKREKEHEHDESAVEDVGVIDGRGPRAESVC